MAYLRVFGTPALLAAPDGPALPLRRKDVALLVYLRAQQGRAFSRPALAALLWGDAPEARARHSLSQSIGRLQAVLSSGLLLADAMGVSLGSGLASDLDLHAEPASAERLAAELSDAPFLCGFSAGPGAEELDEWADRRRAALRSAMAARLEALGAEREHAGDAAGALAMAELAVRVEPFAERAHRRVMRSLAALGELARALRHYDALAVWLARATGDPPDPETTSLAEFLRGASTIPLPPRPRPASTPDPVPPPPFYGPSNRDVPGEDDVASPVSDGVESSTALPTSSAHVGEADPGE